LHLEEAKRSEREACSGLLLVSKRRVAVEVEGIARLCKPFSVPLSAR